MNFHKILLEKSHERNPEDEQVSRSRLKMSTEIERVVRKYWVNGQFASSKHLPALICGTIHYKSTNKIRYHLCTENGIIQGT
jgi:hypothetical protein